MTSTYHTEDAKEVTIPTDLHYFSGAVDEDISADGSPQWTMFTPPPALWGNQGAGPYPLHIQSMTLWTDCDYTASPWAVWDPHTQLITPFIDAMAWDNDAQCHTHESY